MTIDLWLDWLSQPTNPVYKSLLSQVIRIKDPAVKNHYWNGQAILILIKHMILKPGFKKVFPI